MSLQRATPGGIRWYEDGRLRFALGVEDTFVPQQRPGERPIDEYALTEHYRHWHADLGLAREAGAELLRWGVPWYRINPARGAWDWAWLDQVMARFVELDLEPVLDLLHYGTPTWLRGEFANPEFPELFSRYATRVAERYGDVITSFTPVNEPMIHAQFSGEYAYWPPYRSGRTGLFTIAHAIAKAASLAQHGITRVLGDRAVFVHVDAGFRYVGDVDAPEHAARVRNLLADRYLAEDLITGRVDESHGLYPDLRTAGIARKELDWFMANPARPNVMGVNYYPRHSTEILEAGVHHGGGFADPRPTRDDGVAGLREVLLAYEQRYGAPVMLTETCVTATVPERIAWLEDSVAEVHALRAAGHRIVGYTWWPLFDMYEWTYRHTTRPRHDHLLTMGLYDLVETAGTLARRRNPVADRFQQLTLEAVTRAQVEPGLIGGNPDAAYVL